MRVPVELKIKYLNRKILDLKRLKTLLEEGDYSFAIKVGHQMKGNGVTFDVPQIASLGRELQMAAQTKDKETVKVLIQKVETEIYFAQKNF